jgi:hypothetical protein
MKKLGTLTYVGKMFRCTRCGKKWSSLEFAEEHHCAEQKQETAHGIGEETHPEDQRDAMYHMRRILTQRLPRN